VSTASVPSRTVTRVPSGRLQEQVVGQDARIDPQGAFGNVVAVSVFGPASCPEHTILGDGSFAGRAAFTAASAPRQLTPYPRIRQHPLSDLAWQERIRIGFFSIIVASL
jgi:hypothetical protein